MEYAQANRCAFSEFKMILELNVFLNTIIIKNIAGMIPNIAHNAGKRLKGLVIQGIPPSYEAELTTLPISSSVLKNCEELKAQ